MNLKTASDNFD